MKFLLRSLLLSLFLLPAALHASTTAPMFAGDPGTTLTIQGETYTWTSATEDSTWHNDTYTNTTGQTVTVTGKLGAPDLATVSGSSSTGTVAGYLSSGVYGDNHQTSSSSGTWQVGGITYTNLAQDVTYQVNFTDNVLRAIQTISDYTVLDDTPHLHRVNSWNSGNAFMETHDTFTGGHTSFSGLPGLQAFGCTYTFSSASSQLNDYSEDYVFTWTDTFTDSSNGSTISIKGDHNSSGIPFFNIAVWHPNVGTLAANAVTGTSSSPYYFAPAADLSGITWQARSSPALARAQLLLDGVLLNWQSGSIATDGTIIDNYGGGGVTLSISAGLTDFFIQGNSAAVTITSSGGGSGTLTRNGVFDLPGHVLKTASFNRSEPLFTGNATVLKIPFSSYAFAGGYEDSQGNRSDVYVNSSLGMIVLSGTTSDTSHGAVMVSKSGSLYNGTFSNYGSSFSVSGIYITKPTSQPNVYGPPAFWVRGMFYTRTSDTALTYQSGDHVITLGGDANSPALTGRDAANNVLFQGSFAHEPLGVFLVQDTQGAATVPVLPANADGTLHLSWEAPPTGFPPAIKENDFFLVYLGTAADDTNASTTAAYYGSATASDQSPWLIKLRTDGSSTTPYTVTYTDYSTATSSMGSYSAQTHLFQTSAPGSGFPVPVYGVDPNANFALWGLTQPEGGLPPTFMVRGQSWRLAGYDSSTDTATYQGYYAGQQMALGAADASGERLVTLTDPIYNQGSLAVTQGSLNSQRRSALLRDGTLVLSGTDLGQQDVVQHEDDYKLQTIAADLDIVGNNLSFGILNGDASRAGALFNFADDSSMASLHSILSRPLSQWAWWKAEGVDSDSLRKVMWLDADHRLNLYQAGDYATPAIVLDPAGTSSFRGPVRVPQSGDIPMGIYQEGDPP
jgi:hypothetical protein